MASKRIQETFLRRNQGASSLTRPGWNHDVFLSFRGEDTRYNFTDHLYTALDQKGIITFRDDKELRSGENIASELLTAIEQSRIAIIVFSRDYASSTWCLDELVKILECKETMGQTVLPVFYDVDPSDVRKQSGCFAEAFTRHEERFNQEMDKVKKWKSALKEAADLTGLDLRNDADRHESKFIQRIVEEVFTKLNQTSLNVARHPIGIYSRVQDIYMLLNVGSDDVRMVGIYGMGGIGKTTIAKAVYNIICHKFDGSSFLANVREASNQYNGLARLQEQLLYDILMKEKSQIHNVDRGINGIKQRFPRKRVLVVLDDVDHLNQLNSLVGGPDWFGLGSRIIITSRDEHLLEVDEKYKVVGMNHHESLQLFSWHAFGQCHPKEEYVELSNDVVCYAGGLPLALEVLGSFLFKRSMPEWKSALEKLQRIPDDQIQEKLRISYNALDRIQKVIFLDIACFFVGMDKDHAITILDACGLHSEIGITVLVERSLVTIDGNKLGMHDLLRDMGREIDCQESPEPGERKRLWFHEDVHDILTKHSGTKAVEGLVLNFPGLEGLNVRTEAFANLESLRLLKINYIQLTGGYEHLLEEHFPFFGKKHFFRELRWLCWHGFNLKYIPTIFNLEKLVILDMQDSNIRQVWKGFKLLNKLKVLNLSHSHYLIRTPDFLGLPNLEKLELEGCTSLVEVHQSIGHLNKLVFLNLKDCKSLCNLPSSICELKALENLVLFGCSKLDKLPEDLGNMKCLRKLLADGTAIKQLPQSIVYLENLTNLSLSGCKGSPSKSVISFFWSLGSPITSPNFISQLVPSFSGLSSLKILNLSDCNLSEGAIPSDLGSLPSLKMLYLENNNFCSLPSSISCLSQLQHLYLNNCVKLQSLPKLPSSIYFLDLTNCTSLERLSDLSNMEYLHDFKLENCHKLLGIEGLETFETVSTIHMERCNNVASTIIKNLFQGDFARYPFCVILPGNEIPEWFTQTAVGSSISVRLCPPMGYEIKGLIICVVFEADREYTNATFDQNEFQVTVGIGQRLYMSNVLNFDKVSHHDNVWVTFVNLSSVLSEGENELDVRIDTEGRIMESGKGQTQVKKLGIRVVYESIESIASIKLKALDALSKASISTTSAWTLIQLPADMGPMFSDANLLHWLF